MTDLVASEVLSRLGLTLQDALIRQERKLYAPEARKSDSPLRRFTIREAADLFLKIKYNTFRHYLKTVDGLPEGILEAGNRRTYSLEEIHRIQQILYEAGKIPDCLYPRRHATDECVKILCYNLKGGVSKTTLAVNTAQFLAGRGYRVLLIDLDPQSSASDLMDMRADIDQAPSIYDVLKFPDAERGIEPMAMRDVIQPTYFPNLDLVPGSISLTEFEYETASAASKGNPFYTRIHDAVSTVEDAYDIVIYDTPPHLSFAVIAALYASNAMLIPLSAGMLDVVSLVKFLELASGNMETIEQFNDALKFKFIRLILTRYSPSDPAQFQLSAFLRNTLGTSMLRTDFLSSTAIRDASNTMNPLLEIDPSSFNRKTYERILECFVSITDELEKDIMVSRGRLTREEAP